MKKLRGKQVHTPVILAYLELLFLLLLLWFVLSGIFELKFVLYALGTCLLITTICLPSLYLKGCKTETHYFLLHVHPLRFLLYFAWLLKEIIKSALDVSRVVLRGNEHVQSQIIWFRADYDHPSARALLANSITLTPGTVTVDIFDDGTYSVHALTDAAAEGLLEGSMQRKVARLYGEEIDYRVWQVEIVEKEDKGKARLLPGQTRPRPGEEGKS